MKYNYCLCLVLAITFFSCNSGHTPKPRGFFRIDFPQKEYRFTNLNAPYKFSVPVYSLITPDPENPDKKNWINVSIPTNKAELHISYYNLRENDGPDKLFLYKLMEETRTLAYKHSVKANAIKEQLFINPEDKVYGTVYRIEGNAASPVQFFLTDSTSHFIRGALYIRATPDIDSLKPVIDFLEKDINRLIETTTWN
ncbi:MAG: gliding motility lipoprotein GldD [Bacteroidales bacterium]|nr:gliding motility lipoprotein GldD [Bacteroidales bacterium]